LADDGIKMCTKLKMLYSENNPNITTCEPFAKTLHTLVCSGTSGISDDGIKLCKSIRNLTILGNDKITSCEHFIQTLEYLDIDSKSGINTDISKTYEWVKIRRPFFNNEW